MSDTVMNALGQFCLKVEVEAMEDEACSRVDLLVAAEAVEGLRPELAEKLRKLAKAFEVATDG